MTQIYSIVQLVSLHLVVVYLNLLMPVDEGKLVFKKLKAQHVLFYHWICCFPVDLLFYFSSGYVFTLNIGNKSLGSMM